MNIKCLIIAAGQGSRMRHGGNGKPLVPVLGISLIERILRALVSTGVEEFFVVVGYKKEALCAALEELSNKLAVSIRPIHNEHWNAGNGTSVYQAREELLEPFLLLMADHLFDPAIVRNLLQYPLPDGGISLCVDFNLNNPLVDLEDVTQVKVVDGNIVSIGKGLDGYNGFDTGIFKCTPAIFDMLERSSRINGDATLSGAVGLLAAGGKAAACDIGGRFWIDVDNRAALKLAEQALLNDLRGKSTDGPVARYLNRPISIRISRFLARYPVTPNHISLFSFLCSLLAAGMIAAGGYPALALGGLLAQFASVIDGSDGEIARLKFQSSSYGGWLDAVLDRYADGFLLFALTWHHYQIRTESWILLIGFAAVIGSFMVSYTADKYDNMMLDKIGRGASFRLGRDVRVLLIFIGAVFNQAALTLVVIAVLMNAEAIRRLFVCRNS
ncbi:MAG: NTP transferase domain-containing protein [SAR324 cluster bacterium]|nr:NTP transferase domain-containing protein [SAR324 cluster bacterium]